jgi:siroheme synthase-like protein
MPANLFPAFIKLTGRKCLVIGGGPVGALKIASLLDAGAVVTVIAPKAEPKVQELAANGAIRWLRRQFAPADLRGVFMVIAATSATAVNRSIFLQAGRRGVLCN